ncbi:MAG TPA: Ig-like domain-containing protein [Blastocatellia bacterium]|nr:Ig-like domain-containing protein [Blastocatellia bacterium]
MMKKSFITALMFISVCLFATTASADTIIWHASDNPHVINGTYTIPPGTTVIMEPGVIVQVTSGSTLQVEGALIGQGTANNQIQINSQSNYPDKVGGSGRVELNNTVIACPIKPDPNSTYLFSNCMFKMNGFLVSPTTVLYSGMPPYVQLDHCVFMGNGLFSSSSLDLNNITLVLRDVSFQNGSYCRVTNGYVYLDQYNSDSSTGNGFTVASEWPIYFNNVTVTNAAGAGLLLGGYGRGVNHFLGPNTTLEGNGYTLALDSAGLLPGSNVPVTGNDNNAIYGPASLDWWGPFTWPNFGIPYIIGNEDKFYFSGKEWTILPGTSVKMTPGAEIIDYSGGLRALGSAAAPITIEPLNPGQYWYRIHNNSHNARRFRHAIVEGGYAGLTGGTTVIENSIFRNNETATQGASFVSTSQYLNNELGHNGGDNGSLNVGPNASNIFQGNTVAVRGLDGLLDARFNWWGSPTGPQAPSNPGGTGDPIENDSYVRYQPFLTSVPDVSNSVPLVKLKQPYFNLKAGARVILSWDSEDENGIAEHRVYFSRAGNFPGRFQLFATLPGNQRTYEFTVPDIGFEVSGSSQFIRVVAVDSTGKESYDESSFQTPSGRVTTDITITSPLGGETFAPGQRVPVTWTVNNQGSSGDSVYAYLLLEGYDPISIPLGGWLTNKGTLPSEPMMPYASTDRARVLIITSGSLNDARLFFTPFFKIRPDARVGDQAPAVNLQTPASGQSFPSGSVIPITWTASDDEGMRSFEIIASFDGGYSWQPVAADLPASARSYNWQTPVGLGFSDVRVIVLGRDLRFQISSDGANRSFAITGASCSTGDCSPTVSLTSPSNNSSFNKPVSIFVTANATAASGRAISRIEFYDNGSIIATDTSAPYQIAIDDPLVGNHSIIAQAVDNIGNSKTSPPVNFTVTQGSLSVLGIPKPALTSPANGQSFNAPTTITISADRPVTQYTVSRMEFYAGTTLIGTDTTSPYSITWANVPAGSYTICARAVVTTGARSTSAFADITVGTSSCSCLVSPGSASFPSTGGENSLAISTTSNCGWAATSNNSWIVITSAGSGSGNAVVNYAVRDNSTGSTRSGTITIGEQTFSVTQAGGFSGNCAYTISPSSASVASSATAGSIQVSGGAGCLWQATSGVSWITVNTSSGIGEGNVSYSVAANTSGAARKGTIKIAGKVFNVKQSGN